MSTRTVSLESCKCWRRFQSDISNILVPPSLGCFSGRLKFGCEQNRYPWSSPKLSFVTGSRPYVLMTIKQTQESYVLRGVFIVSSSRPLWIFGSKNPPTSTEFHHQIVAPTPRLRIRITKFIFGRCFFWRPVLTPSKLNYFQGRRAKRKLIQRCRENNNTSQSRKSLPDFPDVTQNKIYLDTSYDLARFPWCGLYCRSICLPSKVPLFPKNGRPDHLLEVLIV